MARRRYNAPITAAYTAAISKAIKGWKKKLGLTSVKQNYKGTGSKAAARQLNLGVGGAAYAGVIWLNLSDWYVKNYAQGWEGIPSGTHAYTGDLWKDVTSVLNAIAKWNHKDVTFTNSPGGIKAETIYGPKWTKPTAHSYAPSESDVLTFLQKSPGHFVSPSQVATALGGTITHAKAKLESLTKKGEIQWEIFGGKYGVDAHPMAAKKKAPKKAEAPSPSTGKTMGMSYRVKLYKYEAGSGNQKAVGSMGPYARRRSAAIDAMALVLAAGVPRQDVIESGKKVPTKEKYGKSGKKLKGSSYTVPTAYSGTTPDGGAVKADIIESEDAIKGFKNPRRRNARRRNAHWVKGVNQRNERMWMLGRDWVITERGGLTRPFYETYDIESGRSLRPAPFASLGEAKRGIETFMDNVRKRRRSRGRG